MFHDEHLIKVESVFHPVLSNLEEVVHLEATGGQHQSDYVEEPGEFQNVESPPNPQCESQSVKVSK